MRPVVEIRAFAVAAAFVGYACNGCGGGVPAVRDGGAGSDGCEPMWPAATEPFQKPPCATILRSDFDPGQPGSQLIVNPLAGSCISEGFGTYWLGDGEDLKFDVVIGRGTEQFPPQYPETIRTVALIDGVQQRFSVDGGDPATAGEQILVSKGQAVRFQLSMSSAQIPAGLHSLAIIPTGQMRLPLRTISIVKASYARDAPTNTPGGAIGGAFGHPVRLKSSGAFFGSAAVAQMSDLDLVVRLERTVQVCPLRALGVLAVALLDGNQISLSSSSPYLRADLSNGEHREFEVNIRNLPRDGEKHILRFFVIEAERELRNDVGGAIAPWSRRILADQVAAASWM